MEALGRDLGAPALGAREHLLEDVGSLGSSLLSTQAPDVEGLASGLCALEPRHLLGEEAAEAPPDPRPCTGRRARQREGLQGGAPATLTSSVMQASHSS